MDSKKTAVKRAGMLIEGAAKRLEIILLIENYLLDFFLWL